MLRLVLFSFCLALATGLALMEKRSTQGHSIPRATVLRLQGKKDHLPDVGDVVKIKVTEEARDMKFSVAKFYFHINPLKLQMQPGSENDELMFSLSMLVKNEDRTFKSVHLNTWQVPKQLAGWHSQQVPASILKVQPSRGPMNSSSIFYLQLTCLNCEYHPFPTETATHSAPYLTLKTTQDAEYECENGGCCLKELIVDFADFGMDEWIIAPRQYNANYCSGSCSPPVTAEMATQNSTRSGLYQLLTRNNVQSACCKPTTTKPISILYIESGNVMLARSELKWVTGCGCH